MENLFLHTWSGPEREADPKQTEQLLWDTQIGKTVKALMAYGNHESSASQTYLYIGSNQKIGST